MADDLSPARFGTAFKAFMDDVVAESSPPRSPLLERIQAHLGADPTQLPVIAEEFDSFEHPNVQVALDDYLSGTGRRAVLVGVAMDNKRFMALSLSDLVSRVGGVGRPVLVEGPVDYVNVHLADDRVFACVQYIPRQRRGVLPHSRCCRSCRVQQSLPQQVELPLPVHRPLHQFQLVDLPFRLPIALRSCQSGADGSSVIP